ncbi:MAG: cobalamin biosynthesis protein CbiG [Deltaproteobacteria bacterium]|nr:MAG: cobalamin biosynthesis protein CbiG [Deltaproteobacteria bacterium]
MSLWSRLDDIGVITLTRQGIDVAARLEASLPSRVTVYVSDKYDAQAPSHWSRFPRRIHPLVDEIWGRHDALVFVMAAGIVVRAIAPHVQSKLHDPGVLVMDIRGRFAVALCSGHLGGANELCRIIADRTGATAVVTTGTDVNDTLAPDMLAKQLGARVDDWTPLKTVSGALVDGRPVGVHVDPGIDAGDLARFASKGVTVVDSPDELARFEAAVVVGPRLLPTPPIPTIWLRPPVLVVGIGCNRGTSDQEIDEVIGSVLAEHGWAVGSVARLATIERKADEEGLLTVARRHRWPLWWYRTDQVNRDAPPFPGRSEVVFRYVGVYGVSEPTAMMAAGATSLLVPKQKRGNVTVSVARIADDPVEPAGICFDADGAAG